MAASVALSDELAEEILLRLPPDDPASLVRAALACKRACRLVADPGFRRRFRELHGAPPMLGFFRNTNTGGVRAARGGRRLLPGGEQDLDEPSSAVARFVPTCSSGLARADLRGCRVVDARHGRVLLHSRTPLGNSRFAVWDPVTGEKRRLPMMPVTLYPDNWNAAVFCADAGCNHLDCHGSRFTVVFVAIKGMEMHDYVYSTEDVLWRWPPSPGAHQHDGHLHWEPSALVANALYFVLQPDNEILEYNVGTREMAVIEPPHGCFSDQRIVLVTAEDGGLGVATVRQSKLCLWSREIGSDKDAGWVEMRVIDLKKLLPIRSLSTSPVVAGFANGMSVIFVQASSGLFAIDLKSSRVKKIRTVIGGSSIFPYMSFYNPALGGVSIGDGSSGDSSPQPRGSGVAFGPGAQGGDDGSDSGEHSHCHGNDDDEAIASDEDDDDSEATSSDEDDDDDSEAMSRDENGDVYDNCAFFTSLLFLVLDAEEGGLF